MDPGAIGYSYRMDLRQLRYFVEIADELHFGRAARKLNVAQPSLSQQLKLLEQELGIRLLDRGGRSVALTSAGCIFLPQARAALEQAARALATAKRIASGEEGELAIGFNPSVPLFPPIAEAIRKFQSHYPAVALRWSEETGVAQIAAVASHALDLSLIRRARAPQVPEGVVALRLFREPLFLACHRSHRLASAPDLTWGDLGDERLIAFATARAAGFSGEILSLMRDAGASPRTQHSVGDLISLVALVIADLGVAVLPGSMRALRPDGLAFVPLREAEVGIWLIRREAEPPAPAAAFLKLLRE